MTKTTTITSLILAIAFLVAAQVQADLLTHTFSFHGTQGSTKKEDGWQAVANALSLTATDNGKGGIDFMLSSSWTGDNGGPGILMPYTGVGYSVSNNHYTTDDYVSVHNHGTYNNETRKIDSIFTNKFVTSNNDQQLYPGGRFSTDGFVQRGNENIWDVSFTLTYGNGFNWDSFLGLLAGDDPTTPKNEAYNGFNLSIVLGELDGSRDQWSYATFDTAIPALATQGGEGVATPEPATLAMLGLGLAGLGLVSRRRRK